MSNPGCGLNKTRGEAVNLVELGAIECPKRDCGATCVAVIEKGGKAVMKEVLSGPRGRTQSHCADGVQVVRIHRDDLPRHQR